MRRQKSVRAYLRIKDNFYHGLIIIIVCISAAMSAAQWQPTYSHMPEIECSAKNINQMTSYISVLCNPVKRNIRRHRVLSTLHGPLPGSGGAASHWAKRHKPSIIRFRQVFRQLRDNCDTWDWGLVYLIVDAVFYDARRTVQVLSDILCTWVGQKPHLQSAKTHFLPLNSMQGSISDD